MDQAVALVEAYLELNGYFVVTEYPILLRDEGWRVATDLDILAIRFARDSAYSEDPLVSRPDRELGVPDDVMDMIIGEVKEGRATLNPAVRSPRVISAALERFGCCTANESDEIMTRLKHQGYGLTSGGHQVRYVSFASRGYASGAEREVSLHQICRFLRSHLSQHWGRIAKPS